MGKNATEDLKEGFIADLEKLETLLGSPSDKPVDMSRALKIKEKSMFLFSEFYACVLSDEKVEDFLERLSAVFSKCKDEFNQHAGNYATSYSLKHGERYIRRIDVYKKDGKDALNDHIEQEEDAQTLIASLKTPASGPS